MVLSFVVGEFVAPPSERLAQELRLQGAERAGILKEFRSGVWVKDERSFVNVKTVLPDTSLLDVSIYEFDESFHLRGITAAKRATYLEEGRWQLEGVTQTRFDEQGAK